MKDDHKKITQRMESKNQIEPNDHIHSVMEGIVMSMDNLTGAEFDKAFID